MAFKIQPASANIKIPVRDERMRDMLFDTKTFPVATPTINPDATKIGGLLQNTNGGEVCFHKKTAESGHGRALKEF